MTIGGVTATQVTPTGGVTVDQLGATPGNPAQGIFTMFYVLNAAASTALTVSISNPINGLSSRASSYTGVAGGFDAYKLDGSASTNSKTSTITTIADNSWVVYVARAHGEVITAGSGVTFRQNSTILTWGDSNGVVHPAGNYSQTVTFPTDGIGVFQASFSPTAPPSGPTNVKTWDGITQSTGVKTYNSVALASVKSVIGIT